MRVLARLLPAGLARRALRARHNDFDFACVYWWGDRHPAADDRSNRDFGGDPTRMDLRRCLVCRPYTDAEELENLGYDTSLEGATR